MTEDELSNDSIAVSAYAEIEAVRKTLQNLYEQLAVTRDTTKEIARNELCKSLVERLKLAEREATQLADLIVIARESP
jgi:acetolactate synthase small subunit